MVAHVSHRSCFRKSLTIFAENTERNPSLPSFFRELPDFDKEEDPKRNDARLKIKRFRISPSAFVLEYSAKDCAQKVAEELTLQRSAILLQAIFRGHFARLRLLQCYKATHFIQATVRRWLARKRRIQIIKSVVVCQSFVRRFLIRQHQKRQAGYNDTPLMREMRKEMSLIQKRLKEIQEEREALRLEKERRKLEIRKECQRRIGLEVREVKRKLNTKQAQQEKVIAYFSKENSEFRSMLNDLKSKTVNLRDANESIEKANIMARKYHFFLEIHYHKIKRVNGILNRAVTNLRKFYKPKIRESLSESIIYGQVEAKEKTVNRQGLYKILERTLLDQSCDSTLKTSLSQIISDCNAEFEIEIDVDTPIDLYPRIEGDSNDSMFEYLSDDEKSEPLVVYDGNDFHWIDESYEESVNECIQLNAESHLHFLDSNQKCGLFPNKFSDTLIHSSTSRSNDSADMSIDEYIRRQAGSPISPALRRHLDDSCGQLSSVASTATTTEGDSSGISSKMSQVGQYVVKQSDSSRNIFDEKTVSRSVGDASITQNEGAEPFELVTPTVTYHHQVIIVTSEADLVDEKLEGPVTSFTTCTTEMESDCVSTVSEDDLDSVANLPSTFCLEENNLFSQGESDILQVSEVSGTESATMDISDDSSEYISVASEDESEFETTSLEQASIGVNETKTADEPSVLSSMYQSKPLSYQVRRDVGQGSIVLSQSPNLSRSTPQESNFQRGSLKNRNVSSPLSKVNPARPTLTPKLDPTRASSKSPPRNGGSFPARSGATVSRPSRDTSNTVSRPSRDTSKSGSSNPSKSTSAQKPGSLSPQQEAGPRWLLQKKASTLNEKQGFRPPLPDTQRMPNDNISRSKQQSKAPLNERLYPRQSTPAASAPKDYSNVSPRVFHARAAPRRAPPKIPVRQRNPSKPQPTNRLQPRVLN
jgi:hypothetical protein